MKPFIAGCCLLVLSFLLADCSRLANLNSVAVIGRNFDDEIQRTQNLTFSFNKNIGPEGHLNEWDSTQYIRFKPAVRGKFKWTSPSELVFSPSTAFDPATDYRAELTTEVLAHADDKDLGVSGDEMAFHTPYLQLTGTETWWTRSRETGQPVAKTKLNFNYPVSSADVSSKLSVATEEGAQTTQVASSDNQAQVSLLLPKAPSSKQDVPLTIKVDKGIKVPNTAYQSQEAIELKAALPSRYKVEVVDVQTGYENNRGTVRVITTQELQPGNLSQYYSIQPQVETTVELTENGFLIRGDFNETDTYVLTLTDQIRGVLNTKLDEAVTRDLFFGKMPASIQFATKKALYLSSKGARNIGLTVVNVPKVQVRIAKVYENNIIQFLKNGRFEEYAENGSGEWMPSGAYNYNQDEQDQYGNVLVDKTVDTQDLPKVRGLSALNVAVPDQVVGNGQQPLRGVYLVSVSSKDEAYLQATQLVSVSDIGLITHETRNEVLVWANSIRTAEPLKDIEITLVSTNNQTMVSLKTDGEGFARFDKVTEKAPGFEVGMVTARTADDFNFLYLPDTQVETSRFDVEGKRDNSSGFEAFVYGDRDIYRPGETIHVNTIVRTETWQSVGQVPLTVKLLLPNGREYTTLRKTTNDAGAVATDIALDPAAVTGTYTFEVLNANNVLLTSQAISVEEFIPDRIKVDIVTDRTVYRTGQTITASATAMNLFGPPAADRAYEMELQLKRKVFAPKGYSDYTFDMPDGGSRSGEAGQPYKFEKDLRQARTNANGQATERFQLPATYQDMGLLEAKLFVTVFDENGRPVNRLRKLDVLTQDIFYGVRLADHYVTTNAPLAIGLVGVTKDGQLRPGAVAAVDIVRYDYQTVIEKSGEGENAQLKYSTKRREKQVYTNTVTLKGGKADFTYVPTVSGEYEVRVRRQGAMGYTATSFYAYGYGSTVASSFDVSQEGQVLMEFDKPAYETGDKAKVLFKAPFNGKLLVTIERNKVLEQHWLTTENKSAEWTFSVGDAHLPNVYITATLIRALDETNLPLTVAHGFASVAVQDPDTKLPVEVVAASASRSKTKQTIRIKTKANAQVTVAVVDEGILQLKNFKTPDPHGFFYQKRALEVGSHDLYALLFPELSLASRSSSGGDGYDLERRVNPLSNGRVRLVAVWSGILETGFDGEAEFTVDIPQFSGDLRVMAVAYKDDAFGSASHSMKVADPIVISTGVPRFLSPDDELQLPVNLSNTTNKPAVVQARLGVSGPLTVVTDSSARAVQKLTIPAGREVRAVFRVRAQQAIGAGTISVAVSGFGNEVFTEKTDITVRPAASLQKVTQAGAVAGGKSLAIGQATADFLPGTSRSTLSVSRSPVMQYGRELAYLLGYPHGCLEQTISKAFPQIYFADLTRTMGANGIYFVRNGGESDLNPATNVRQAIQKIEAQQVYNGGFGMWPGQTKAEDWASAYAVHFLTEAGQAGYEVRSAVFSKGIDFLTAKSSTPAMEDMVSYDESGTRTVRQVASRTNIYSLYVLANAGKPNRAAMNYYKQNANTLTIDSRYMLAAAFFRIGDVRSYTALLPKRFIGNSTERETGGSYASPLRNLALVLQTLVDADPDNIQIPDLARQLSGALRQAGYLNTQEAAYAFLALGKLARKNANSTATATIVSGKQTVGSFTGTDLFLKRVGQPLMLTAKGTGNVYYFWQSEGVPATGGIADEDNGLQVRRTFLSRDGQPLSRFRQNDLIVVRITLSTSNGLPVQNVVITDLLPAGFEIENPRITEPRDMDWLQKPSVPDHFDVRDDRINFYTNATGTELNFYYMVRAVSKGKFVLGPVSADAMYNAAYRSYSGSGGVIVE